MLTFNLTCLVAGDSARGQLNRHRSTPVSTVSRTESVYVCVAFKYSRGRLNRQCDSKLYDAVLKLRCLFILDVILNISSKIHAVFGFVSTCTYFAAKTGRDLEKETAG